MQSISRARLPRLERRNCRFCAPEPKTNCWRSLADQAAYVKAEGSLIFQVEMSFIIVSCYLVVFHGSAGDWSVFLKNRLFSKDNGYIDFFCY